MIEKNEKRNRKAHIHTCEINAKVNEWVKLCLQICLNTSQIALSLIGIGSNSNAVDNNQINK